MKKSALEMKRLTAVVETNARLDRIEKKLDALLGKKDKTADKKADEKVEAAKVETAEPGETPEIAK